MRVQGKDDGTRAGSKHCTYCGEPKGTHKPECVCLHKTVVLEMVIPYVVEVPDSWSASEIEHHRNETGFCLGNDTEKMFGEGNMFCLCGYAKVRYVRDANEEDMQELLPFPEEQEAVH